MKNNHIENTIDEIKKISLTSQEKSALFDVLNWYAESNPSVKSPYSISVWTHQLSRPLTYVLASLLIILLAGGSTVFASERALPGDMLYPVKVHISEPIKVALATNSNARQAVRVAQVEERLKEAETLAIQGRLATSTSVDIQQAIVAQVDAIKTNLNDANKDHLEVALAAHEHVLESIKKHSTGNQKNHIEDIQVAVGQTIDAGDDGVPTTSIMAARSVQFAAKIVPQKKTEAEAKLFTERKNKVQKTIQDTGKKIQATISDSTSTDSFEQSILNSASSTIRDAEDNLKQAEDNHSKNNDVEADVLIRASEKKVQEASISIDRGLELGKLKNQNKGNETVSSKNN